MIKYTANKSHIEVKYIFFFFQKPHFWYQVAEA